MLERAWNRVKEGCRTAEWAVGLRGTASPSAPHLSHRSLKGESARALLQVAGRPLAINPVFILGMTPGATADAIRAGHAKASAGGGSCMVGLHGGNTETGYTKEQHAKACAGRASMHEDAINILFANWGALPLT
jgi:hypothetical protein